MKVFDLFVKVLEVEGVEYVFGIFGEENFDLLEFLCVFLIKLVFICYE